MIPLPQLKQKKPGSLCQIFWSVKGFRISQNDRHNVKCMGLLFFNVQNLEMLLSRNASIAVFNGYLVREGKKKKKTKKIPTLSFSCSQKAFHQALSCNDYKVHCVSWKAILIFKKELASNSWEALAIKEHAWRCSHVTTICNFKSFLMWVPFALSFMLFAHVCWLHHCCMFCIGSCWGKNLRHVVWLKVLIFSPFSFLVECRRE